MNISKTKNIFFPIESIGRELDYKLLVAINLIEDGERIVFGQHDQIDKIILKSNSGIYFGKNIMRSTKQSLYNKFKKNKISIVHLDEEGAIYAGDQDNWRKTLTNRLNISKMHEDDYVCTWGKFQKDHFEKLSLNNLNKPKINVTGNPRLDLLKKNYTEYFREEINSIKNKYGEFILINNNFWPLYQESGNQSFFSGNKYSVIEGAFYHPSLSKRLNLFSSWKNMTFMIGSYIELAHYLSDKFKNLNIIIRPHPDENLEFYKYVTRDIENIQINDLDNINPLIHSSKLVIHNRCTTGLQAYMSNKPIVIYDPLRLTDKEDHLLHRTGRICYTMKNVSDVVEQINSENYVFNTNFNLLDKELIFNLENESLDKLVSILNESKKRINTKEEVSISNTQLKIFSRVKSVYDLIKRPIRKNFFSEKYKNYKLAYNHFPGFDKEYLNSKIDYLGLKYNKNVKLNFFGDSLFAISL